MNEVQIFNNAEFGEVRTILIDGEPWFVANDIGKALQYSDPRTGAKKLVDDEDKQVVPIDSAGQMRQTTIINESGLYSMIFGSTMQKAKEFKRWVTSEVLPSIRKTGSYEQEPKLPKTPMELLELHYEAIKQVNQKVDSVSEEVSVIRADMDSLRNDLPILPIEADRITEAVRKKATYILGGRYSTAYTNKSLTHKVYSVIYANLKHHFGISSYKSIKRSQCEEAIRIINAYTPPEMIQNEINMANSQRRMFF